MAETHDTTEQLFRAKYGSLLAALLRRVGYSHFDAIEEALQSAFQRALEAWPAAMPANPAGWLYTVAYNYFLANTRRLQIEQHKLAQLQHDATLHRSEQLADARLAPTLIDDDLAVMLLLCCNPELNPKAQVCLTLKAACGLSVHEIARALAMQDEAVKKTITRAKARVAEDYTALRTLQPERIAARFGPLLDTLYALFNEGYAASSGEAQLRCEIADAAIRLTDVLLHTTLTPEQYKGELYALIALMLFQRARFAARSDPSGLPIRLQAQDRGKWDQTLIRAGMAALASSRIAAQQTALHLEARIAAAHALSPSFDATDWGTILQLYDQLIFYKDGLPVRLSRIVALRYAHGWRAAIEALNQLETAATADIARSFLFHAVRADLLATAGESAAAAHAWAAARAQAPTVADQRFVEDQLKSLI